MKTRIHFLLVTVIYWIVVGQNSASAQSIDFGRDILPLLSNRCFTCHGPDEDSREGGFRLDLEESALGEADSGEMPIVPGEPSQSELLRRLSSDDESERMPPPDEGDAFTAEEVELLRRWIDDGAEWQKHWSFVAPQRPELPNVQNESWPRNPIDRFVLARLEAEGMHPSVEAAKETLIRRVTLDLTGLPPTPEEVDSFLTDDSPDAYEQLVDRLFASPRYGERMVWPWLDAARYADTNGYQGDAERTQWPWRDWAIAALNDNMPFDQFTIEQLAGDLLPNATLDQRIATGFHRNHMQNGEGGRIAEETRVENVMDRVETTATVWLGITMTCCRCHDHKYDPLTTREYYGMYDFFNQTSETGANTRNGNVPPAIDAPSPDQQADLQRREQVVEDLAAAIVANEQTLDLLSAMVVPEVSMDDAAAVDQIPENVAAKLGVQPARRSPNDLQMLADYYATTHADYSAKLSELKQAIVARNQLNNSFPRVMVMDHADGRRQSRILIRGAYDNPGEPVEPGTPAAFPPLPDDAPRNRLTLARWLVSPEQPLTARVTVNRYWQLFFGRGLVSTPEDFGVQGSRPSHPQLLDWLAVEFVESGWDVKHIHKLIVMSATYRQSSRVSPELLEIDPKNVLLAREPRYRLPSWMIRDQALAVSGLFVEQVGGAPVNPYQPDGVWEEATFGKKRYSQDHGDALYRRSLYTFWRRIIGPTTFFDTSNRQICTVYTARTNTPLHALITLNDVTYVEAARALAQRTMHEGNTPEQRIGIAFFRLTSRQPTLEEMTILLERLAILKESFAANADAAIELLSIGESRRDENLDPSEHAAYTALCSLLLNLDETLTRQ